MGVIKVNSDLLGKAREAGIDVSRVAEEALARAIEWHQSKDVIREEIRRDREALAEYLAKHGDPVAEWNEMFGHPCNMTCSQIRGLGGGEPTRL